MRLMGIACLAVALAACHSRGPSTEIAPVGSAADPATYTGHDANDIPYYTRRAFTPEERALLRRVYGIEDPSHLYVSDSTGGGLLKYDTDVKTCRTCYVNSYRVGFVSLRHPGESWDSLEVRVHAMTPRDFHRGVSRADTTTASLDPDIRADVEKMLADARRAGFHIRVSETYRSPEHEAWLMSARPLSTHTLTSLHSYGRAIDIVVGDGNRAHPTTKAQWIAFRKWVIAYRGDEFRILGAVDDSWDWPHVELPSAKIGFHSIEAVLARARACDPTVTSSSSDRTCEFIPHLPAGK